MSILKFTSDSSEQLLKKNRTIKKTSYFNNKVVITNGFNASGKTLVAPLVSSMERAELMTFAYEIEWCSSFLYSGQLDQDAYSEFVRLFVDHTIYNQLMGRSVNCRPSDLSNIFNSKSPLRYIRRMFRVGDNAIPPLVKAQQPILSLVTCHLLSFLPSLATALNDRLVFIEVVRDPIYMFHQLLILFETVIGPGSEKDFTLRSFDGQHSATYLDFLSPETVYEEIAGGDFQLITVSYLERMFNFYFSLNCQELSLLSSAFVLLPFERFVLSPKPWLEEIVMLAGSEWSKSLDREMKRQKVPRKLLRAGRDLPIYRRFGWSGGDGRASTLQEEYLAYRAEIKALFDDPALFSRLEQLSDRYSAWIESFGSNFVFRK